MLKKWKTVKIVKFDKNAIYTGEVAGDVPNGKGKCVWNALEWDDTSYKGDWADGKMHGQGTFDSGRALYFAPYERGWVYTGGFANDLFEGHGVQKSKGNGWVYEGEFKNGKRDGRGVYTDEDGSVWTGTWVNGKMKGHGTVKSIDGWTYEGEFKNDRFDGYGVQKGDDWSYEGEWKYGNENGKGVFKCGDTLYDGEWDGGHMCGKCKYKSADGWTFEGEWKNFLGKGNGKMVFDIGDVYEGDVRTTNSRISGMTMDGQGTYTSAEGDVYTGGFKDGEFWGEGVLVLADGKKIKGEKKIKGYFEGEKIVSARELRQREIEFREMLEEKCKELYGDETDIKKRYEILQSAYFQSHNSGFNDAMAWEAASGNDSGGSSFWETACRLKYEVECLCDIYKKELE